MTRGGVGCVHGIELAGLGLLQHDRSIIDALVDVVRVFELSPRLFGGQRLEVLDFPLDQPQFPPETIARLDLFVEPEAVRPSPVAGHRHGGGTDVDLRLAVEDALGDEAPAVDARVNPRTGQSRIDVTLPGLADAGHRALHAHPAARPAGGRIAISNDQMHMAVSTVAPAARMVERGEIGTSPAGHFVGKNTDERDTVLVGKFLRRRGHDLRDDAGVDSVLNLLGVDPTLGRAGLSRHPLGQDGDRDAIAADICYVCTRRPEGMGASTDRAHVR